MHTQEQTVDRNSAEARKARAIRLIQSMQARTVDRGCSEAEAMEASEKISALMAQNELELTDIVAKDTTDIVQREVFAADDNAGRIITGIGKLCSLTTYHDVGRTVTTYVMFGHAADVELGVYLYEICMEAADVGWSADMDANGYSKKKRDSFRMGFAARVATRMYALREQRDAERRARMPVSGCTDLVILKDQIVEAEFEKTGIRLVKTRARPIHDPGAYRRGQAQGDKVNLNNPLTDGRGVGGAIR